MLTDNRPLLSDQIKMMMMMMIELMHLCQLQMQIVEFLNIKLQNEILTQNIVKNLGNLFGFLILDAFRSVLDQSLTIQFKKELCNNIQAPQCKYECIILNFNGSVDPELSNLIPSGNNSPHKGQPSSHIHRNLTMEFTPLSDYPISLCFMHNRHLNFS